MRKFYLPLLIIAVLAGIGHAQESSLDIEESIVLEEVVITATRTEEEVLDVPQHVTVVTEGEIRDSGAKNISELLNLRTGVSVYGYGSEGAVKSLSLRGSTSSQVLILIDGVRMNNSLSGGADLSLIPLDNVEKIEIVHGGTSALYGADAVGGVVNIITKKKADNRLTVSFENGSSIPRSHVRGYSADKGEYGPDILDLIDTQKAVFSYSHEFKTMHLTSSGAFIRAGNGFIFTDSNFEDRKRENADLIGGNLSTGLYVPLSSGAFDVSGSVLYDKKGIPGSITSPTLRASQKDRRVQGTVHYGTQRFFNELVTFDLKTYFIVSNLTYTAPSMDVDSNHDLFSAGLDLVQEMLFFNMVSLIYGGNISYEKVNSTDVGENERVHGGGFIEAPIYPADRFILQPAVRYDYYSDFKGDLNFKLGGVYRASGSVSLKGSISKSYRAPTFNDLYWPADFFAEGNPDLTPETGYGMDFGITTVGENMRYDIFGFIRYVRDVILWQPGADDIWRPTNYGEGLYPGIEAYWRAGFLDHFTVSLDYTLIYTFALSGKLTLKDNLRLPLIPIHDIAVGCEYKNDKNLFYVNAHYGGLRYEKVANVASLPAYFVVNLLYKRSVRENLTLYIAADNLFGEEYETVPDYPMPGFFIRTGIEATF